MRDLIVIGGGEHARVVIEAALTVPGQWHVVGFVDPSGCEETAARLNVPRLGDDDCLVRYPDAALVLGKGTQSPDHRRQRLVARTGVPPERWAVVIHHVAWVSPSAEIGPGTVVMAGAVVNSGARIGRHCIVNTHACIEHDVTLGDYVHAGPGSIVAGGAIIGEGSYLGMGSLVRDHCTIGHSCLVGMGAAVTKTFGKQKSLIGVPATVRGSSAIAKVKIDP